ncbi:crystallin J1A-like [Haliotis rubra]|uniref:crystallin J1A-like n=1 Tax=Haliotis rubra TaxID=36100 RepID=UPI001EE5C178|nr:crystallin J1A-like [Haliotis rubra]
MSTIDERRCAAVIGALVADAAAEPLHWIYNDETLKGIIDGKEEIEFLTPSSNPFYEVETGEQSCYGDQELVILRSLVTNKGINLAAMKKTLFEVFGPGSVYEKAVQEKEKTGAKRLKGPYRNGSVREFLKKYSEGKANTGSDSDDQMDCVIRSIPVVALYAGKPDMLQKVEEVVRISHNAPVAVACSLSAARLLEYYIVHGKSPDAVEQTSSKLSDDQAGKLQEVLKKKNTPHNEVAKAFGRACSVPGAWQTAIHAIINASDFTGPVRTTSRAGGGNCSRSGYIGACMAAQYGLDSIPESWRSRTNHYTEIKNLAEELIKLM